jgi:hypothetical protein
VELQVLGRHLVVDVDDEQVVEWIGDHWDFPATAQALDAEFTIEVTAGRSSASPDLTVDEPEGVVTLTLTGDGAVIGIVGTPFRAWNPLYRTITEAILASGVILLHAAVITRGDRTLALCAPSGVGKSTTAMAAAASGWTPIAEDLAWLDPTTLGIFGGDRRINLREPSLRVLGELHPGIDPGRPGRLKYEVSYDQLGGRVWTSTLTDVVDLRRDLDAASAWTDLDRAETVMTLLRSTGVPALAGNRDRLSATIGSVARQLRGSRLLIGSTPLPL